MGLALRWGDRGGGRMNRLLNMLPKRVQHWRPIREFLTYQVCLRAKVLRVDKPAPECEGQMTLL